MSKDRNRGNREAKKPKADKKPATAGASFLRPQQPAQPAKSQPARDAKK